MFQRLSNFFTARTAFVLPAVFFAPVIFCLCCAFADLRPIGVSTIPEGPLSLLPEEESPVVISFDTDMEKQSVERALQIYSPGGMVEGSLRWEERNLLFDPVSPWMAGIRYGLKLSGTVASLDGRELLVSKDIPFYAVSRSALPYVVSFFPLDGASVSSGTNRDGEISGAVVLELNFSVPMDSRSTEDALKLDIPGKKTIEWPGDGSTLRLISDKPLNPWSVYRWSISEKALSAEGAPLAKEFSGCFISDLDKEFLTVVRIIPLIPPEPGFSSGSANHPVWGAWIPAGVNLEQGPGPKQGIGVEFNKPVESDSLRRAFSFVPTLSGRVEILSPVSAVFIPARDPAPETVYTLRITGALKDTEGLKMGEDYTINFRADIPFLDVDSATFDKGEEKLKSGDLHQVKVTTDGILRYTIHFSLPFDTQNQTARQDCVFRTSLRPFFPETLSSVSLSSASWISSDRLRMEWKGAEGGKPGERHYYRLIVSGGSNGVHNGLGSYLKEDFILYLEAET
jgi:hypothetical protein